ncbi:NAD-dependent epimerase/dehydratase family protein [Brucella abortus]|nr:NAD-dependent epimerase/dehydratase family protein [Brucella abortus]
MSANNVLVVGGAGFIGGHTASFLAGQGYAPVVYDNLSTKPIKSARVRWGDFVEGDIRDQARLDSRQWKNAPVAVIHFAASAYVGESVEDPAKYYRNNVGGTQSLLDACRLTRTQNVIFSSSCATYGVPSRLPIGGEARIRSAHYGRTS